MDLLAVFRRNRRGYPAAASWILSSEIRPSSGFASAHRLMMQGFFNTALSKARLAFMVTTEQEALDQMARTRPGLLMVTGQLEQDSGLALVEQARSVVEDIRTILILNDRLDDLVAAGLSTADAVVSEADCFGEDEPVVTLIRSISLGQRYRSRSVKAAMAAANEQGEA